MPWLSSREMRSRFNNRDRGASTYDRWLTCFLYSVSCLEFEVLCYRLRILICVDIDNLEPAHLEDVYAIISVRRTVDQGVFCRPSDDDGGVMGEPLHEDVVDGKGESRYQTCETLEPTAQCLTVMTLTAQGVRSVKAMMNVGGAVFEQGVEVLLVYSFKV